MNTTLSTARGRVDHPPQPVERSQRFVRRVGLLDRLALHIGVALITWGRRPSVAPTRAPGANRFEQPLPRVELDRSWDRAARLTPPVW
jgi:hypothetical protein